MENTSVVAVTLLPNAVVAEGAKLYVIDLACGCSWSIVDPPEKPPSLGAAAVCRSADGNHLRCVTDRPGRFAELSRRLQRLIGVTGRNKMP